MTPTRILALAASGLLFCAPALLAQSAKQAVTYEVASINEVAVTAPSLQARGGDAVTTGGNWSVTTNQVGAKVSASVARAMPEGVTLSAQLGAPSGASSAGLQPLGTTSVDLVTGISQQSAKGLSLTYQLDASVVARVVGSAVTTVTYTMTGGA